MNIYELLSINTPFSIINWCITLNKKSKIWCIFKSNNIYEFLVNDKKQNRSVKSFPLGLYNISYGDEVQSTPMRYLYHHFIIRTSDESPKCFFIIFMLFYCRYNDYAVSLNSNTMFEFSRHPFRYFFFKKVMFLYV